VRVLTVCGTRPEAIKLAPVIHAFRADPALEHILCATGQHRQMLDQVLQVFDLTPDHDINIMKPGQDLSYITAAALDGIGKVIDRAKPDWVVVQGDTTTAFAGALAAFYRKVKVAHVEAGLRTGNIYSPWPEEMNRKLVGSLSTLHFPPTQLSADNLRRENIPEADILVTGNTVIDALFWMNDRIMRDAALRRSLEAGFAPFLNTGRRLILVTGHRRENHGRGLEDVARALRVLADRGDVEVVYPVHLNPRVQETATALLSGHDRIHLIAPLEYAPFVALMRHAHMIVTDSGGIQEEAPSLGKPVLVTRDTTERPEAVSAGAAKLVGATFDGLLSAARELLDDAGVYSRMARVENPFGDGRASARIVTAMKTHAVAA
jgi:UDP-N-acetylglucosamine 2-epimerase